VTVVDTPVWSELFRRKQPNLAVRERLADLIREGEAVLVGPVRQEVLSGVKDPMQFETLRGALRAFPDEPVLLEDYEGAARFFNQCRAKGVQGSNTDFLLCATAKRLNADILTLDRDFLGFAPVVGIRVQVI
jgi:predicted nucleic acid-binding protein